MRSIHIRIADLIRTPADRAGAQVAQAGRIHTGSCHRGGDAGIGADDAGQLPALQRLASEAMALAEDRNDVDVVPSEHLRSVAGVWPVFPFVPVVAVLRGIGPVGAAIGEELRPGISCAE